MNDRLAYAQIAGAPKWDIFCPGQRRHRREKEDGNGG
jgi:hypothetical protein